MTDDVQGKAPMHTNLINSGELLYYSHHLWYCALNEFLEQQFEQNISLPDLHSTQQMMTKAQNWRTFNVVSDGKVP